MSDFLDLLIQLLTDYGQVGMFVASFLAGCIFPISSELVLVALLGAGLSPFALLINATLGNTLGAMCNYGIGRMGKEEWVSKYLKVKDKDLERGKRWVRRWGYWIGLISWIPVLGEISTVALGYLRANVVWTTLTIFFGKFIRYWLIIQISLGTFALF